MAAVVSNDIDASGDDLDLWGDGTTTKQSPRPDPRSSELDCVGKLPDGTCPASCAACGDEMRMMEEWLALHERSGF